MLLVHVLKWLLDGDVSIQYLTHRDLLGSDAGTIESLQQSIGQEGYGAAILSRRSDSGHWGLWFYQPKWTCTHYALLDLKNLGIDPGQPACREMVLRALDTCMLPDGGLDFSKSKLPSDIAINGMFLDYASWFCPGDIRLRSLAEFLLTQRKGDGGFSWDYNSSSSDPHTTICALEGLLAYQRSSPDPRIEETMRSATDFLLDRNLCVSEDKRFLRLAHPHRYRYDLLRFLCFAASCDLPLDEQVGGALDWLLSKRKDDRWNLELVHPGAVHVQFEPVREPSRFITLKALSVLTHYGWIGNISS